MRVNQESALRVIAVYSAVTLIAGTAASLPVKVYAYATIGGKRTEMRTPGTKLLWGRPNPSMSRQVYNETIFGHMLLWGNAYIMKVREGSTAVAQLWPIRPDRVTVKDSDKDGNKSFVIQGDSRTYTQREIIHIPFFSLDGVHGLSPIGLAREGIGLSMAAEEFGARFFGQGSQLSGVITTPSSLTKEQSLKLAVEWERKHAGLGNSHRPAILDNGASWQTVGIPPDDAQFLQTRQFQVQEIARLFRVPPHLIAEVSGSTSWGTGIAEQNAGFHRYTLMPLLTRVEQEMSDDADLLFNNQQMTFDASGLLRANMRERYQSYLMARTGGWESPNDIRALEDEDPFDGGDSYDPPAKITAKEETSGEGLDGTGGTDTTGKGVTDGSTT
jgi:HK97 family phage portal protein